jgi:hypothetical protein
MAQGIQDNTVNIQVDVVLTKKGREYKSIGSPLGIPKKFALSDDGINYNLYDSNLPDKGIKITRTPMFDAWTNENNLMVNKIIALPRDTQIVPSLNINPEAVVINVPVSNRMSRYQSTISIQSDFATPNGYVITILDKTYLLIEPSTTYDIETDLSQKAISLIGDPSVNTSSQTIFQAGTPDVPSVVSFTVFHHGNRGTKSIVGLSSPHVTSIRVESVDTGISKEIQVTLKSI